MTEHSPNPAPAEAPLSFEQAKQELAEVVQRLEAGGLPLEDSLALWERGDRLADRCTELLDAAQLRLSEAQRRREANSSSSS